MNKKINGTASFLISRLEKDVRGFLTTLLILAIIKKQERTWGYKIKQELKKITDSDSYINDSSLYTILRNLESNKYGQLIISEMDKRRRYYTLTPQGFEELTLAVNRWIILMEKSKKILFSLDFPIDFLLEAIHD